MKRKTPDFSFPNLKRLAKEPPTKRMKALRLLWPRIRRALDVGKTLRNIQRQVQSLGITIGYKSFQKYVSRLRKEDQLKNRQSHALPSTLQEARVAPAVKGRTAVKPIAFVIPGTAGPKSLDWSCWNCGRDMLACRCSQGKPVC
jgi:hypothetical protein